MGSRCPHMKGQFWGRKGAGLGHVRRYSKRHSRRAEPVRYTDASWSILMEMHIGVTWRIGLKRPCKTAMRPYVKLLWPLFGCAYPTSFRVMRFRFSKNEDTSPHKTTCFLLLFGRLNFNPFYWPCSWLHVALHRWNTRRKSNVCTVHRYLVYI